MMKITQLELVLTHSPRKNTPSQVELFSVFNFKSVTARLRTVLLISYDNCFYNLRLICNNYYNIKLFFDFVEKLKPISPPKNSVLSLNGIRFFTNIPCSMVMLLSKKKVMEVLILCY